MEVALTIPLRLPGTLLRRPLARPTVSPFDPSHGEITLTIAGNVIAAPQGGQQYLQPSQGQQSGGGVYNMNGVPAMSAAECDSLAALASFSQYSELQTAMGSSKSSLFFLSTVTRGHGGRATSLRQRITG